MLSFVRASALPARAGRRGGDLGENDRPPATAGTGREEAGERRTSGAENGDLGQVGGRGREGPAGVKGGRGGAGGEHGCERDGGEDRKGVRGGGRDGAAGLTGEKSVARAAVGLPGSGAAGRRRRRRAARVPSECAFFERSQRAKASELSVRDEYCACRLSRRATIAGAHARRRQRATPSLRTALRPGLEWRPLEGHVSSQIERAPHGECPASGQTRRRNGQVVEGCVGLPTRPRARVRTSPCRSPVEAVGRKDTSASAGIRRQAALREFLAGRDSSGRARTDVEDPGGGALSASGLLRPFV